MRQSLARIGTGEIVVFVLRPDQLRVKQAIGDAFARGRRAVLGVMATGAGKSVIAADMAAGAVAKGHRVLVISGRRQVIYQLHEHCSRNGMDVGIVMGNDEMNLDAPVQVASIQTLQRRGFSTVGVPTFAIVDEAHQFYDATKKIIQKVWPTTRFLGFTATPVGPQGAHIGHFEEMVEPIKNSELIAAGHLLPVHPYLAPSEPDMSGIDLKRAGRDEVGNRVGEVTIWGDVFKEWAPYKHLQTLVLLPSRAICQGFWNECHRRGIDAKIVDGTTPQDEREETFYEFKQTDCQVLLGIDVLQEGLDLPIAQCLIDLHPTHQMRRFWQAVGRVKRPHPGQSSAVVIDFAGNLWRHMLHPDQDPPWNEITNETTIEEIIERKAGVRCPNCGSKDIYSIKGGSYKCEDCKHEWQTHKPWVCPQCKQSLAPWQKVIGGKCPNCGEKVGTKPVRRIRMADGSLRTVPVDEIRRRKKSKADGELAAWTKWVYIANGWNHKPQNAGKPKKTLNWCRAMFQREQGHWPRSGMKYMPDAVNFGHWKRCPSALWPWLAKGRSENTEREAAEAAGEENGNA